MSSKVETMKKTEIHFPVDEIRSTLKEVVKRILNGQSYKEEYVPQWCDDICDSSMKELHLLEQPYKYVVTCIVLQQTGVCAHCAVSCKFDKQYDHVVQVVYKGNDDDDNEKEMNCIITAVGIRV